MPELVVDPVAKCAYTSMLFPYQNYGGMTELWACVVQLGTYWRWIAHLECDISEIEAGAVISSDSKLEIDIVHRYADDYPMTWLWILNAWDEYTITYNNPPRITSPGFEYTGPNADGPFTITGSGLAGWLQTVLDDKAGKAGWATYPMGPLSWEAGFRFRSDDAPTGKPKLTVVYSIPSEGPILRPGKYLY